ncbi:MAG: hypothetical protein Q8P42_04075 [Gallionella sp.]|nr:hypothetical protein [Gallionella sp.]
MNTHVEDVLEMARTWPTKDQAELLDALFGLVSPTGSELEAQWVSECGNRCAAIDSGEMPLIAADLVMAKYRS